MIDIHCHILPGIDDGAKSIEDSIQMAEEAVRQGIRTIIATPHYNSQYANEKPAIIAAAAELNETLAKEQIPLTILPGQETRIYGELLEDYDAGKLLPLAETSYFFIELPSGHVPRYTERVLFDMQMKGLIPIIVHPERNQEIIQNPDMLYRFVKNGALTQITAGSLTGQFGKNIKKFTGQLIEANLTHFIASDAHNVTTRSFKMTEAFASVEKTYGMDTVFYLKENAEMLASGKKVYKEIPNRVQKKKFLGIF
ncbi:tyrosine-protein phosphatase [Bacillus benzoevorans]|uniref:Tyrosine-protein phosphatase n=1 Tax=Bacillus benzoevorans TaxID=1456 RepID=A0A7X0HVD3_9BACI|nr:CpsB/CapC family capsule biosynthesis tyrosine phosphatase [Bacillus benzoevorans]MBB6447592.1 protein-tyrosine phosphatase [Bacillus benzoevorans]